MRCAFSYKTGYKRDPIDCGIRLHMHDMILLHLPSDRSESQQVVAASAARRSSEVAVVSRRWAPQQSSQGMAQLLAAPGSWAEAIRLRTSSYLPLHPAVRTAAPATGVADA